MLWIFALRTSNGESSGAAGSIRAGSKKLRSSCRPAPARSLPELPRPRDTARPRAPHSRRRPDTAKSSTTRTISAESPSGTISMAHCSDRLPFQVGAIDSIARDRVYMWMPQITHIAAVGEPPLPRQHHPMNPPLKPRRPRLSPTPLSFRPWDGLPEACHARPSTASRSASSLRATPPTWRAGGPRGDASTRSKPPTAGADPGEDERNRLHIETRIHSASVRRDLKCRVIRIRGRELIASLWAKAKCQ